MAMVQMRLMFCVMTGSWADFVPGHDSSVGSLLLRFKCQARHQLDIILGTMSKVLIVLDSLVIAV